LSHCGSPPELKRTGDDYQADETHYTSGQLLKGNAHTIAFPVAPWNPYFKDWLSRVQFTRSTISLQLITTAIAGKIPP
jgi:hypothetical protein